MALHQPFVRCAGAALLLALVSGCSGSNSSNPNNAAPTVQSTTPIDGATDVPRNASIVANFSEPMDPDTLNDTTFQVTAGVAETPVLGTVVYGNSRAIFWPSEHLAAGVEHDATIRTGAQDSTGVALAQMKEWSFTTGSMTEPTTPVDLGTAGDFAILSKAGISTVPDTSDILGDLGVSPIGSTSITGFALNLETPGTHATSPQVDGLVYASDYSPPTPSKLTTAISDMEIAYTDASARAPDVTELDAGLIGSVTALPPGVYKWSTGLEITADVNLVGTATDVWIFQIAQGLTVANGIKVTVNAGALPENVFWQVAQAVDLGTTSVVDGILLSATAIALKTSSTVNGRLLAQTAVTLDTATVTEPAQ